jgi:hypothetical protein
MINKLCEFEQQLGRDILDALDEAEKENEAIYERAPRHIQKRPVYPEDACPEIDEARHALDEAIMALRQLEID